MIEKHVVLRVGVACFLIDGGVLTVLSYVGVIVSFKKIVKFVLRKIGIR